MVRKNDSLQKAAMREMMRDYLKTTMSISGMELMSIPSCAT